jgi:hypothetical protein
VKALSIGGHSLCSILKICSVVSEITYADGRADRQRDKQGQMQANTAFCCFNALHAVSAQEYIILCLFGFPWHFKINSPFLCSIKEFRQVVVLYFKVLCEHLTAGTE